MIQQFMLFWLLDDINTIEKLYQSDKLKEIIINRKINLKILNYDIITEEIIVNLQIKI